jgi:hypothetical protein
MRADLATDDLTLDWPADPGPTTPQRLRAPDTRAAHPDTLDPKAVDSGTLEQRAAHGSGTACLGCPVFRQVCKP